MGLHVHDYLGINFITDCILVKTIILRATRDNLFAVLQPLHAKMEKGEVNSEGNFIQPGSYSYSLLVLTYYTNSSTHTCTSRMHGVESMACN